MGIIPSDFKPALTITRSFFTSITVPLIIVPALTCNLEILSSSNVEKSSLI